MMILVHITSQSGVFEFVAIKAASSWRKTDSHFIITIPINCCRISIFGQCNDCFINRSCYIIHYTYFKVNPVPYLISEVLFSNIGGTATLIGDPPNIMIGSANKHLDFNAFLLNLAPIVIIISIVTLGIIYFMYRNKLKQHLNKSKN